MAWKRGVRESEAQRTESESCVWGAFSEWEPVALAGVLQCGRVGMRRMPREQWRVDMNRVNAVRGLVCGALMLSVLGGCAGGDRTRRVDPQTDITLARRFNDSDARIVAQNMIPDCLNRPWVEQAIAKLNRKPIIAVGEIRNRTDQVIETEMFTGKFEEELLNSGRVDILTERAVRDSLRLERSDTEFTDPAFIKKMKGEMAVDYILSGSIVMDREFSNNRAQDFVAYQVKLELLDVETLRKVWIKTQDMKKERY